MANIEFTCAFCNNKGKKPNHEYQKSLRLGRSLYCSRKCAGLACIKMIHDTGLYKKGRPRNSKYVGIKLFLRKARQFKERSGLEHDITHEYLVKLWDTQNHKCAYTDIQLRLPDFRKGANSFIFTASLDRIDSNKGYLKDNVHFVSMAINYMKNTMTDIDTKKLIKLIKCNGVEHMSKAAT